MHFKKSELYKSSSANLACFSHSFILMFRGIKGGEKIKVGFSPPPQKNVIGFTESSLEKMKNAFYFNFKVSFLRYLSFRYDFWSSSKNGLIRRMRLISKFMSQLG